MAKLFKTSGVLILLIISQVSWSGCEKENDSKETPNDTIPSDTLPNDTIPIDTVKGADVVSVTFSGGSNGVYNFSVGIFSPDIDCSQYANWWELVSEDGTLIARRILTHSHVPPDFSQPFIRSASVTIDSTTVVWVRGHMNNTGYKNGKAFKGSIATGFVETSIPADFALDHDNEVPDCAF